MTSVAFTAPRKSDITDADDFATLVSHQRVSGGLKRSSESRGGTHVVVQEVLDGSVHVRRDVGTFDLTQGQTQAPAQHQRCPGNHPLNTSGAPGVQM